MKKTLAPLLVLAALAGCAADGTMSGDMGRILEGMGGGTPGSSAPLTETEILGGLREALGQGTTRAIHTLGRSDGFWADALVRIALPESVRKIEGAARRLGQGALVDEFHLTLNRAAEQAVPQVADIFGNAVRRMSFADARGILFGADDAATQFFRRTTASALHDKVRPIVAATTQRVGVTQQYKRIVTQYGPLMQMAGVKPTDLDAYVTSAALDGLFLKIADEEKRIRDNPVARTTELLRRVFGSRG